MREGASWNLYMQVRKINTNQYGLTLRFLEVETCLTSALAAAKSSAKPRVAFILINW
jgi:hypothetical protein